MHTIKAIMVATLALTESHDRSHPAGSSALVVALGGNALARRGDEPLDASVQEAQRRNGPWPPWPRWPATTSS